MAMEERPAVSPVEGPPGVPTWVKVLGLLVLAAIVVMIIVMVSSNGDHGPSRHSAPVSSAALD